MLAIMRREFKAYFTSPIGYIVVAAIFFISGVFFTQMVAYGIADMRSVFSTMYTFIMFLMPMLTMRLMSEDKKIKTDQILLTSPVTITGIVMGKYLAAVLVFIVASSSTLAECLVLGILGTPDWGVVITNYVAMILLAATFIAVGMFISALTENQVVAAIGAIVANVAVTYIDGILPNINNEFLDQFISDSTFTSRYSEFMSGMINFSSIMFFLSIIAVFLFLCGRVLEKRRWE
ncbi:MAG: ABC transporter permease subunit [Oscillospiraceae bacterium]|nr:ABC transporter permease subunit [Oscillospiraceae bacterium]MBQ9938691.1 ABC transporter permease subunit [Oscillospiraceae bacterium]